MGDIKHPFNQIWIILMKNNLIFKPLISFYVLIFFEILSQLTSIKDDDNLSLKSNCSTTSALLVLLVVTKPNSLPFLTPLQNHQQQLRCITTSRQDPSSKIIELVLYSIILQKICVRFLTHNFFFKYLNNNGIFISKTCWDLNRNSWFLSALRQCCNLYIGKYEASPALIFYIWNKIWYYWWLWKSLMLNFSYLKLWFQIDLQTISAWSRKERTFLCSMWTLHHFLCSKNFYSCFCFWR